MIAFRGLKLLESAVALLYPPVCVVCGADVPFREQLCDSCQGRASRIVAPFCRKCSQPFEGALEGEFTCANCAHRTLYFEAAVSAYRSRGVVRQIIHDFKYGRQVYLRHSITRWLEVAMNDERISAERFDVIAPVPLHPARQRERGFNQASLLAELLSKQVSVPWKLLLERHRYTTTQTALDRAERIENLRNAFRLRKNIDVRRLRILLIDDVLTTGATLSECARVLKNAGATSVYAVTAARG